jgi:hypothetical protein
MKRFCLDTSGLSTPLENMPEDIHSGLWVRVADIIKADAIAVTTEIYDELCALPGSIGECIKDNEAILRLEVGETNWDWKSYLAHVVRMKTAYAAFISENHGNRKNTICLNDLSIIALAKTLGIPVISSEKKLGIGQDSVKRQKIPDICDKETIRHLTFNEFLRGEGITL